MYLVRLMWRSTSEWKPVHSRYSRLIHVQYTETESIRLKHLTIRLDSHVTSRFARSSRLANRLPAWRIDNRGNDSCRFDRMESNRQHFQPTLHSPPEVKIRKTTIHEPSSFLKRDHKPQSIRTIRVDSIESTRINNIFNPPSKSRSTVWNRVHESISGLSNRKHQRRIDSSWMHRPLQKRERTGKEHGCFPFVWKTEILNWKINYILESFPRIELFGGGKWPNGSSTNITQNREFVWIR